MLLIIRDKLKFLTMKYIPTKSTVSKPTITTKKLKPIKVTILRTSVYLLIRPPSFHNQGPFRWATTVVGFQNRETLVMVLMSFQESIRITSSMFQLCYFVAQTSSKVKLVAAVIIAITQSTSSTNNKSKRTSALLARTFMMGTLDQDNLTLVMEMKRTQVIQAINQAVIATSTRRRKTTSCTNFVTRLRTWITWHPILSTRRSSTTFKASFSPTSKLRTSLTLLSQTQRPIHSFQAGTR